MGVLAGLITVTLATSTALAGAAAYHAGIADARHVAGAANVYSIAQAAQADEIVHGTDQHTALVNAAASCACGVSVQPGTRLLVYRTGDHLIEFNMDTGRTIETPVSGAEQQPDISQDDGTTHTILVNLNPTSG